MIINGLKLPGSFVEAIRSGRLRREIGSWGLKENVDAYGNFWESELGEVYEEEEALLKATDDLPKGFEPDEYYGEPAELSDSKDALGFIPDIVDFSRVVCFGMSGDGAPFCFDFREDANRPSVIWWEDISWRRVAPDFESFVELFDLDRAS